MPIRPENVDRYPPNWPEIRARILVRSRHRCEQCGVGNHAWGWRESNGTFNKVPKRPLIDARKHLHRNGWVRPPFTVAAEHRTLRIIEIVLTIAHLDHVPEHCDDENLRSLCQRCHLLYDQAHHAQTRYRSQREGRALGDLFEAAA